MRRRRRGEVRITFLVDGWIWKDVVEGAKHYFAVVLFNRIGCDEGPTANRIWHTACYVYERGDQETFEDIRQQIRGGT